MSHASTATITLGGAGDNPGPQPVPPQYGLATTQPATTREQAAGRRERRRRQNVPDHMRVAGSRARDSPQRTASPAGMQFGTIYTAKPGTQTSTTAAAAYQTQSLFKPQQQGDISVVEQPSTLNFVDPQELAAQDKDALREEEARQKLKLLNLSPEVIAQYRRKFTVLDLDKDGVVNLREFAAISRVLGYKFTKMEILEIFGRRDLDDSGGISFDEFVISMYARSLKTKELAPYREKFRLYDVGGRGYITSDEAYPVLKRDLGFDESKTEMIIDMYDRNKDYRLSLLEFIDFYKKVEELKLQVQSAFRDFDRNGDGYVDPAEAKVILMPKGFSDQQVEALVHKYDQDMDGKLNYKEFLAFWDVQLV